MAVNRREPPLRTFSPRWPDRDSIDPDRVALNYWSEVDTLMIDLFGEALPAVSVPLNLGGDRDYLYLRLNPSTGEVVGFQVEDFLTYAVNQQPFLVEALALARLHGKTADDLLAVLTQMPEVDSKRAVVDALFAELAPVGA